MAQSLFDYGAKSRRQRERLRSIYENPEPEEESEEDESESLFPGPDGGTQGEKPGGKGYDYSAMTPAEFNQAAQNRANAGFMDRHGPGLVAGMIPGGSVAMAIGREMDRRNFEAEQALRSAEFKGLGQMMPDEMMQFGPVGMAAGPAPAPSPAEAVSGSFADIWQGNEKDLAGSIGEQPGLYARGGKVTKPHPQSLFGNIDPPGPDDQLAGVKTGERILNEEQYASLSKEAKAEVDAALKKTAKRK